MQDRVIDILVSALKSANKLLSWVEDKAVIAQWRIEEHGETRPASLEELFAAKYNGLFASYRDEFDMALHIATSESVGHHTGKNLPTNENGYMIGEKNVTFGRPDFIGYGTGTDTVTIGKQETEEGAE